MTDRLDALRSPTTSSGVDSSFTAAGAVGQAFRRSYSRLVATLTHQVGARHVGLVEDSVQNALMSAVTSWAVNGVPHDPDAWLYRAARNEPLDALRKDARRERILEAVDRESIASGSRLPSVHAVLYLLFNEGYLSSQPDRAIRRELCDEAIWLTTMLAERETGATPETFALLALMHLHGARLASRVNELGDLLLLEEQDRSLWDAHHIRLGVTWLRKAASGETFTRFHAEAGIAAEHVLAPTFAETRWNEIAELYEMLDRIAPSPLNAMNRAVAIAECRGPEAGLSSLATVEATPWLLGYYLWDAVLGELHRRAGHDEAARHHVERALGAAPTEAERHLLRRRLTSLRSGS